MFEYFPLPCFHHPPGDFLMPLIRYFSIEIARTATTVTLAPAAEVVMILGDVRGASCCGNDGQARE